MCTGMIKWYDIISIHAPARGATIDGVEVITEQIISIHAPARGATEGNRKIYMERVFQSTLPRGERHHYINTFQDVRCNFNPRSREGSDTRCSKQLCTYNRFQSTLPRGERLGINIIRCIQVNYFNPRSREGSDEDFRNFLIAIFISIHAPARGATYQPDTNTRTKSISIHAPARGATYTPQ